MTAEYPTTEAARSAAIVIGSFTLTPVKMRIESGSLGNASMGSCKTVPRIDRAKFSGLKRTRISSVFRSEKAFSKSDKSTYQP